MKAMKKIIVFHCCSQRIVFLTYIQPTSSECPLQRFACAHNLACQELDHILSSPAHHLWIVHIISLLISKRSSFLWCLCVQETSQTLAKIRFLPQCCVEYIFRIILLVLFHFIIPERDSLHSSRVEMPNFIMAK